MKLHSHALFRLTLRRVLCLILLLWTTWQAYKPPASLGLPLSVPSACGLYEIFHLK